MKPNTPHSIIIHSGTSNYLNFKTSIMLSLLSGRYRLNYLKAKFSTTSSPICNMCNMNVPEDIPHFILDCPYLDGARMFAILLWSHNDQPYIYYMFLSAFQLWPCNKLIKLLLDPSSQFDTMTIRSHDNKFLSNTIKFSQDFLYSIHRQRNIFYGEEP